MKNKLISIIALLKKLSYLINNWEKLVKLNIGMSQLNQTAMSSTEQIIDDRIGSTELVVSLTTYSKRIHDVHLVIESIAKQTKKPNRIILWLDKNEFNIETIPLILKKQKDRGLEIRFCENYRSYKKLIPTMKLFPNANIITIDDDILYPHDTIEMLLREHVKYPKSVVGHRAHSIKFDENGKPLPYGKWDLSVKVDTEPSFTTFLTSGAGTLFPAGCFSSEVLEHEVFLNICPNADDIWFHAMLIVNGTKSKKVNDTRNYWDRYISIVHSQDIALAIDNVEDSGNDRQLEAVYSKYKVLEKIKEEN
ncbi:putative glycosyltransferase [Vibrio ishigakensis]|uniref:Putative glycosyltransferase n=1 Tax=Vibrio ishigakensis TaxID=1481914 RepID=A0A0B8NXU4_9VIBR|nr:glycosyl transferase [Vibrio ishigakensis]GAM58791.1 putative glycosyltransferase [Vibrio ishigakensis]